MLKNWCITSLPAQTLLQDSPQRRQKSKLVDIIIKPGFVSLLEKTIEILSPIHEAIVNYESDPDPISEVFCTFKLKLPASVSAMKFICDGEGAYLLKMVNIRMTFMSGDAHGIAYLLDPCYLGMGMSIDKG